MRYGFFTISGELRSLFLHKRESFRCLNLVIALVVFGSNVLSGRSFGVEVCRPLGNPYRAAKPACGFLNGHSKRIESTMSISHMQWRSKAA